MAEWGCISFAGARFRIWQSDVDGANTSEAVFDPYSFAHAFVACYQFMLVPPPGVWQWQYAYLLNLGIHAAFEVVENTPPVIRGCRAATVDKNYKGDTVVNSAGDLITFTAAYFLMFGLWTLAGGVAFVLPIFFLAVFCSFYCEISGPNSWATRSPRRWSTVSATTSALPSTRSAH